MSCVEKYPVVIFGKLLFKIQFAQLVLLQICTWRFEMDLPLIKLQKKLLKF